MSSPGYFGDNTPVLLTGITGAGEYVDAGGKTSLANWWAATHGVANFDLVIFFNAKGTPGIRGERVHDVEELADAMAEGKRHFDFAPRTEDWAGAHENLREFVNALPTEMSKLVVHDETPDYEDGGDGSLGWFLKIGGQEQGVHAANCKSLVLAQDPVDLPTNIRKMCTIQVWVGPLTDDYHGFFAKHNRLAHYEHILEVHEPYWWTVMLGSDEKARDTFEPVPEEYA